MKFDVKYSKLSNEVRVLTIPMAGVESVTTLILVKTGSRNEMAEQAGISHVLEHMVFKGTKKYPSPMAIAETVDGVGAEQNAFTSKEYTGFYITSAAQHVPLALDVQAEMLTKPLLPQTDLEREREVIVEEINMYEDHPMERAIEEFENLIYNGSNMGRLIIGKKETVRATTSEALRKYMNEWYYGANVMVVMAGAAETVRSYADGKLLEPYLGGMRRGGIEAYLDSAKYGKPEAKHMMKKSEQAHFVIGVPGISMSDPSRYALQIAQVILGGPMSSRLFNEIREKRGLAYYVQAIADANSDCGYLAVRAGVKLEKLGEAMKVVKEEMLKLSATFTEAELKRGKDFLLGKLPLQLEETMEVAQFFGMRALILNEIRQPDEEKKRIQEVTLAEVKKVVADLMSEDKLRSMVIGPKGE